MLERSLKSLSEYSISLSIFLHSVYLLKAYLFHSISSDLNICLLFLMMSSSIFLFLYTLKICSFIQIDQVLVWFLARRESILIEQVVWKYQCRLKKNVCANISCFSLFPLVYDPGKFWSHSILPIIMENMGIIMQIPDMRLISQYFLFWFVNTPKSSDLFVLNFK